MHNSTLGRMPSAFGLSVAVTSVLTALLVIAKETTPALKAWMKAFAGHHWTTHGLITLLVFVALALLLAQLRLSERLTTTALTLVLAGGIVLSGLLIFGFYLVH